MEKVKENTHMKWQNYKRSVNKHFEFSYWAFLGAYCATMFVIFLWLFLPSPACRTNSYLLKIATLLFLVVGLICLWGLINYRRFREKTDAGFWKPDIKLQRLWPWVSILAIAVFPSLTVMTFKDLVALETGNTHGIQIFCISKIVYDTGGFLPAVLSVPLLGLLCFLGLLIRLRRKMTVEQCLAEDQQEKAAWDAFRLVKYGLLLIAALIGLILIWLEK